MKLTKKITIFFLSLIFVCGIIMNLVEKKDVSAAETARISVSSGNCEVGDTVDITISVSGSNIMLCDFIVNYDASMITPVSGSYDAGGNGVLRFISTDATSFKVTFKAIKPGTASISVAKSTAQIGSMTEDYMNVVTSSGSITITAPQSYSTDNTLSSLEISPGVLSPAFSPNVTTYTTSVGSDCQKLTVSAVANDSKATVSVTGTRMDIGLNTTTITVTAEDGSVKKYIIYTTRLEDGQEATTEAESKTEAVTEDASQKVNDDGTVTVDGRKYSVVKDYSGITIPDGYQEIDYDYNGQKINAVKGIKTGLILMYLESEDGKGGFYIYDETAKTFSPYNTVAEPEITYVVLPITNSLEKPAGYALTRFTMNGKEVQVLMDANRQYCLFYGVSSLGEKGWFRYRISDGSIQAYSVVKSDTANADVKADNGKTSGNSRFWLMIVLILGLIIAVFIVITIVLCSKLAKVKKVFNMASKDGVDLDEYTEKVIDGYAEDEDDSYEELDTSSDKISYGDDKSGKSDVEELKLFDVEDDK